MTFPSTTRLRRRGVHAVVGVFAALALVLTLPGTASAASESTTVYQGGAQWRTSTDFVLQSGGVLFERDQRRMAVGQQDTIRFDVTFSRQSSSACGSLVFQLTRYQAYTVYWQSPDGRKTTFLYRGGLVADGARPYVGVFYLPGNKLAIQTYSRSNGKVVNPWVAATATAPTPGNLVLYGNGLWISTGSQVQMTKWLTGPSPCVRV